MIERGEQWTDMRSSVFDALASFDRPASAYDIAEAVSKARGKRGPAPKIQQQLERVAALPKAEQRVIARVLDSMLAQARR